jgi:hypothetical protein
MPPALRPRTLTFLFFLFALVLIFGAFSVGRWINIDENVFIASAALVSRGHMLYRDFHYNHLPTLVLIYAAIFHFTTHLVLAARSFSALCAAGAAAIFFHVAYKLLPHLGPRRRFWFAFGIGLILLSNPLFTRTAGRSWNHDFPVLTSLLAFLVLSRGMATGNPWPTAAAGFFVGLAVTARLTFATELLPFVLFPLIYPGLATRRRVGHLLAFAAGGLVAAAPTIYIAAQAPAAAYFDNFRYPALNTEWHRLHDDDVHNRYTLAPKLWFYLKQTWELPGNGIVTWGFIILLSLTLRWRQIRTDDLHCRLFILTLLAASQLAAGLVPSPPFLQYVYAAPPFMLLAAILCMARLPQLVGNPTVNWIFIICIGISIGFSVPEYRGLARLFWPPAWQPLRVHNIGVQIAGLSPPGVVLTMDPIYPLEGGRDIYPPLATGCFGVRVGDYLPAEKRQAFVLWGSSDIDRQFALAPPACVLLTGDDNDVALINQFIHDATDLGYHRLLMNKADPYIALYLRGIMPN